VNETGTYVLTETGRSLHQQKKGQPLTLCGRQVGSDMERVMGMAPSMPLCQHCYPNRKP
jgi:hypothetical protein